VLRPFPRGFGHESSLVAAFKSDSLTML